MIIPCQKLMLAVFSDSVVRTNESTFPQSESGTGSEVALQPLDYRIQNWLPFSRMPYGTTEGRLSLKSEDFSDTRKGGSEWRTSESQCAE